MAKGRKRILYKLRTTLGLTPSDMAILLHKDVQTIRAYETDYVCKKNIGRKPTCLGVIELLTLLKLSGTIKKFPFSISTSNVEIHLDDILQDFGADIKAINERIEELLIKKRKENSK